MIVYGSSFSPFVRKTLGFIAEKGLRAEHIPVTPHDPSSEFRACSPFGKIPAFQDGDFRLADIAVHCAFVNFKMIKQPVDATRWPKLAGYVAGLLSRPTLMQIRDQKAAA